MSVVVGLFVFATIFAQSGPLLMDAHEVHCLRFRSYVLRPKSHHQCGLAAVTCCVCQQ
jgi:hypothetical protein